MPLSKLSRTARIVALLSLLSASPALAQPSWVSIGPPGARGIRITGIGADPTDSSTLYVGAANGVYRTTDRGLTWTMTSALGGLSSFTLDAATPGTLYALGQAVWKTTNEGTTWSVASGGIDFHSTFGWSTSALAADPDSPATLYAGLAAGSGVGFSGGVYKTTNGATTWVSSGLAAAISALAVDPSSPSTVYAAAGYFPATQGLFKTADGGTTWTKLGGTPIDNVQVFFVAVAPGSPSTVFVTTYHGSYRSRDGGLTWSAPSELQSWAGLTSLLSDPLSPGLLFAGTGVGVYRSADGGDTWVPFSQGLSAGVTALALSKDSSTLYAGTEISGVFKLALDGNTGPCLASASALCLVSARFQVGVSWRSSDGASGLGQALSITSNTGAFWFFSSDNLELVIKVLDGRPVNGSFWVFYGALSNVEYTITVTDTQTGAVKTYVNPQGQLASVADTGAF